MAEFHFESIVKLHESIEKISLENIASVTFNAEALKTNFEVIVHILKGLVETTNKNEKNTNQNTKDISNMKDLIERLSKDNKDLNERVDNHDDQIKSVNDQTKENTSDIQDLKDAQNKQQKDQDALRNDQNNLEKAFKDSQVDLDKIKKKLVEHDEAIEDLLNRIRKLNAKDSNPSSATNVVDHSDDIMNLEQKIAKLNQYFVNLEDNQNNMKNKFDNEIADIHKLLEDYVKKDEFNGYKDQTNNKLNSHQDSIDDLYKLLKNLEAKIGDKLDCEAFDVHVGDYNVIKGIVLKLAEGKSVEVPTTVVQNEGLSTKYKTFLEALMINFPNLEDRVKKLEKGLNDHMLVYKTFSEDATKKIANNEENLKNTKAELNKKIADLEALIKGLKDSIANLSLNSKINTDIKVSSPTGLSGDLSAELRKLQISVSSVTDRVTGIEGHISDLFKLREKVFSLDETSKDHGHRISALEDKFAQLKLKLDSLEQLINTIKSTVGNRGNSPTNNVGGDLSYDKVKQMIDEEINKLRDELLALIEALKAELAKKADHDDLDKLEGSLLKKLDEIVGILMNRIQSDKDGTKKALVFLEKRITELTKVLMGENKGEGDGKAILATMPWNPWACASCNSRPKEFPGALIDYKYWSKVPKRDTSPSKLTQGKFGKGWPREQNNKRVSSYVDKRQFVQTAGNFHNGAESNLPEIQNGKMQAKQE